MESVLDEQAPFDPVCTGSADGRARLLLAPLPMWQGGTRGLAFGMKTAHDSPGQGRQAAFWP